MRFKLFLICLGVVVLSLASGLGLRFALAAWQEPTEAPPGGNVPGPINIGSSDQTKTGGLTIGGIFRVTGAGGVVVGTPTGDNMGPGVLNAEKLCIQGVCLTSWAMADAFMQNGNSFGTLATLGTNDNFPLAFETNNIERMRIDAAGNVGIGTENPLYNLVIRGASPRTYIWSTSGNPELDLGDGTNHWAIYRDAASDELRFWRNENNLIVTSQGDVNSRRCFGAVYAGQTAANFTGNLNGAANVGYDDANALCNAAIAGSHICTAAEILETVKCNRASLPTTDLAWISNGPPGYTARANDCTGWTSTSPAGDGSTVYGAIWAFDANGGVGWVTTCNMSLKFACCK